MRKQLLFVIFLFSLLSVGAQTYNNEWINFSQPYYKIKIPKDGLYKIDYAALSTTGIPLASINPQNIQLFQKGVELYVHIQGEADGQFNNGDYILFYAEKNKSTDDSSLYVNSPFLPNPYYSIISDTSAVFLTINSNTSTVNKRLTVATDTSFAGYVASPYYIKENIIAFNNEYNPGPINIYTNASDPRYMFGEGLAQGFVIDPNSPATASITATFNTNGLYTNGPAAHATVVYSGGSNQNYNTQTQSDYDDHLVTIEYSDASSSYNLLDQNSFDGYQTYKKNFNFTNSLLGSSTNVRISSVYNSSLYKGNRSYLHYAKMVYPQTFNLNNLSEEKIYLPDDQVQTKSYLVISNFNTASSTARLIDLTNHTLIPVVSSGSNYKALVPNTNGIKYCFLGSDNSTTNVSKVTPINGTGNFVNYQTQPIDSAYIIVTHQKLLAGATLYANYRKSTAGDSYNVLQANIEDLYNQFSFGVEGSPYSIRNFVKYLANTYPTAPKNLFLIGKNVHASDCITSSAVNALRLVPSFGNPSSDNLITQGLINPSSLSPFVATGRLAAQNDSDIVTYLNKIILNESQTSALWQKNILHFVGGADATQQAIFESYMNYNKSVIEDTLFGGRVYTFKKSSTAPIGINTNDSIREVIENGVDLITFFGHGSYVGFEQNIDDPFAYNNSPKFPFMMANSCYTGDIHTKNIYSNSEKFVLANNHGTIGFLASVSAGVSYALEYYTKQFYENLSYRKYGATYGDLIKQSISDAENVNPGNPYYNDTIVHVTCLEMTLHGDPAARPYTQRLPDYTLTNSDVSFNIQSSTDSINLDIKITNLAKAVNDSFIVNVLRILPSGNTVIYLKKVKAPYNQSHLNFNIYKDLVNGIGLNKFSVELDFYNSIPELSESNNATIGYIDLFIPGGDIVPIFPNKYAIIPGITNVTLKASTADPFAPLTTYRIQLDTNDSFTSTLVNTTVTSKGGVVSLPVSLLGVDSIVYFWRVGKDSSNAATINWRNSSFQVITGKYGWEQAHFDQFNNDTYQYVKYNKPNRKFEFSNDVKTISVNAAYVGPPYSVENFYSNSYYINNDAQNHWTCGGVGAGWTFAIFDSISGIAELADTTSPAPTAMTWYSQYQSCICTPAQRPAFDFGQYNPCHDPVDWRIRMENFLNTIPVGKRVLAYSHDNDSISTFSPSLINAFKRLGSDSIQFKPDTCQMIIWGTKEANPYSGAHEVIGKTIREIITLTDTFPTKWNRGYIASEIIGPSTAWRSLHWNYQSLETPSKDSIYLKLVGIRANGQIDTITTITNDSLNILDLYNYVNANTYPYLQLIAFEQDDTNHTAPQLKKWQVIYDPIPEAALNPPLGYTISATSTQEGEKITVKVPIQNIGDIAFTDSLLISYWIEDANLVSHQLPYKLKKRPFLPDSILIDTLVINTVGYPGANALWIDVNPLNNVKHQLEQQHFNNVARIGFNVGRDKINPLLDVTFDGIHILNGDIVSSRPNILITLKDENKFLALNDTTEFAVYLKSPGAVQEQRVYFNNNLQFTPAQLPNNSCKIIYNPALLNDGKYELTVQAKDRSNNISGYNNYKIQFEIINKSSITDVLNYPNPFSTSTKFVFTLTGSEVPETFKIQIMTITGKVVREITQDQIGPLHIGRNITEYAWDGKDDFGDQLANGVYLYRVVSRLNGQSIDHRDSGADEYIKKGFGKMVLMR